MLLIARKKKSKKVTTIEVEENIEEENILNSLSEPNKIDNIIEVKDRIINTSLHCIREKILF